MRHTKVTGNVVWVAAALTVGCGYSGGEALFMSGLFKRPEVKAKFELTDGPVAVLVDDMQEVCYWPEGKRILAEAVLEELEKTGAAERLVPASKVSRVRQTNADFEQRGCREIGQLVGAHQVVWVRLESFFASEDPTETHSAARMGVTVKVINALEDRDPTKVRLWPKSPSGHAVHAELSGARVVEAKTRRAILQALSEELATALVKDLRDRPMEDFE